MGGQMYRIAWKHKTGSFGVNEPEHNKEDADVIVAILNAKHYDDEYKDSFTYWAVPVVGENAAADAETSAYLVSQGGDGELDDPQDYGGAPEKNSRGIYE